MARLSKAEKWELVSQRALKNYDRIIEAQADERAAALSDRRFAFVPGAQYDGAIGEQFANKPKMEINRVRLACIRVMNEYLNNQISVKFVPKDGRQADKLAQKCEMLYRADELDSAVEEAYNNAFHEMAAGGMGGFRMRAVYEDESDPENEHQRIKIEPVFDADSVMYFDPAAKRQDKADARYALLMYSMGKDDYIEEFGDDPSSWPHDAGYNVENWSNGDLVWLAEYYEIESETVTMVKFEGLAGEERQHTVDEIEDEEEGLELLNELMALGYRETSRRKIKRDRVHKWLLSGGGVLDDCGLIAGSHIPLVPAYGLHFFIDGVERFQGIVRVARDSQIIKNVLTSKLAEISAMSAAETPLVTPEQIAGHETSWANVNMKNPAFLKINPTVDPITGQTINGGPVGMLPPPNIPPALAALLQLTDGDLAQLLGAQQGADQMMSNVSGDAVEMIQQRIDANSYIYLDGMAKAIRRGGEIWLSMARELYTDADRKMKGINEAGQPEQIELGRMTVNPDTYAMEPESDLTKAVFDVAVDTGPTSSSQRQATVRSLLGVLAVSQDPESRSILEGMILQNLEGNGMEDIRDFSRRKMVAMGVVKPTNEERAAMEAKGPGQPSANDQYLQSAAQEAQAKAAKANADTVSSIASAELKRAQTVETLAGVDMAEQQQAIDMMASFGAINPATAQP